MKKFFLLAVLIFSFFTPLFADDGEKSVISIDQAQKVENSKDPVSGDDCIVLIGNVVISVTRGGSKTTIRAERVNYNRVTEMLYAEGSVSLEQSGGSDGGEKITATSLLFNTSTLEGIFDNGRAVQTSSDAINLPSGSTLIVASEIFGRDSGGTIAFKTGELTFCDDENPHWRIKASRIWLLPGGEFAFLNALLFVGHVPLLYLPAFYYPKDELIFNPTFGYRPREGYYINTTTYLYGRKPSDVKSSADVRKRDQKDDSSSSEDKINFFSFMNTGTLKEQRREGLVLHNLDENYKGDTSKYFKILADYYANLGTMVGFDGVFAPNTSITNITTKFELGFSNTIFRNESIYLPKNAKGEIVDDTSNFMGIKKNYRYQGTLKFVVAKPFSFTVSMPLYSDPFYEFDFGTRAETMDWIDFAMNGNALETLDDELSVTEISTFTWSATGSYSLKIPEIINPYITTLSISNISSSIVYSSKANDELTKDARYKADETWEKYTPERKFYYPSQITPVKVSGRLAGTLIQVPAKKKTKKIEDTPPTLTPPGDLNTEEKKDKDSEKSEEGKENSEEKEEETEKETPVLDEKNLPELDAPTFSVTEIKGIDYSLGYSVSPDFTSQFSYSSTVLKTPDDFNWNDMQSTYIQLKSPTSLTSKVGYRENFVTLTDTFTFDPVYQKHPYIKIREKNANGTYIDDGGYTPDSAKSIEKSDYAARKMDLTDVNALTFKPFYYTEHFSETSLTWNTTIKMIRTNYIGAEDSKKDPEPIWEYLTTDLKDEECFTVHNLNLVLGANEFDKKVYETLSLTTTLPPQVDAYSGVLTIGVPYIVFTAGTGVHQKSKDDDTWVKDDFKQTLSIEMFDKKLKFSQSYVYKLEDEEKDSLKFSLSGFGLQASYTASYVAGYEFINGKGWVIKKDKEFQPYQWSLAYASGTKTFKRLGDRISFSPNVSMSSVYDYLRPTNSYFRFIPALTFKVNNFLNVTFSAESKNSIIYRYFCSDSEYQEKYRGLGERNFLKDLMDSFRFDDEEKRKASAFKIQNLKIDITHDLDDWDLNCSFSIKPRLLTPTSTGYAGNGKSSYYDFSPYFTISVSWRPLASMKTQIVDEYGEWKLNP